jgi:phosphatidylglycerophosphate synthase
MGKFLDPLRQVSRRCGGSSLFSFSTPRPLWMVIVIVGRDVLHP